MIIYCRPLNVTIIFVHLILKFHFSFIALEMSVDDNEELHIGNYLALPNAIW